MRKNVVGVPLPELAVLVGEWVIEGTLRQD